jgi:ADP-heptose:LPS heptosyltransferase
VEGLSDRFETALCDAYAEVFAEALGGDAAETVARYRRIREPRAFEGDPRAIENVFVLSRVTLGADVAVTSAVLDAARRRFPDARVFLVGGSKNWELFEADPRIGHVAVPYPRSGAFEDRLAPSLALSGLLDRPSSLVIDPDSRLSQLGLVPVCADDRYYFFESRSYGANGNAALAALTGRWLRETFGVEGFPWIAPKPVSLSGAPFVAVSLGVGDNPQKRIADPFERKLLQGLLDTGMPILIDKGAGGEETERVERLIAGTRIQAWQGAFAPFASMISQAALYVGYDSAGQHVAAACGVPLVTVFAGFPTPRMFERWKPSGRGPIEVVRVEAESDWSGVLDRALAAVARMLPMRS